MWKRLTKIDRRRALAVAALSVCAPAVSGCNREHATNTEFKMPNSSISLRALQEFDDDVRSRVQLPRWADAGIGCLGLILDKKPDGHTNKNWQPTESWHDSVGYTIRPHHKQVLELLIERFALRPWQDPQHFYDLQKRFGPLLELPAGLSS